MSICMTRIIGFYYSRASVPPILEFLFLEGNAIVTKKKNLKFDLNKIFSFLLYDNPEERNSKLTLSSSAYSSHLCILSVSSRALHSI